MGREVHRGKEQSRWSEERKEKLTPSIKQRIFLSMETAEESQNVNIFLVLFYIWEIIVLVLRHYVTPDKRKPSSPLQEEVFLWLFLFNCHSHWINHCKYLVKDLPPLIAPTCWTIVLCQHSQKAQMSVLAMVIKIVHWVTDVLKLWLKLNMPNATAKFWFDLVQNRGNDELPPRTNPFERTCSITFALQHQPVWVL